MVNSAKVKIGNLFPLQLQPPCLWWTCSLLSVARVPKPRASEWGFRGAQYFHPTISREKPKKSVCQCFILLANKIDTVTTKASKWGNFQVLVGGKCFEGKVVCPLIKLRFFKRLPFTTNRLCIRHISWDTSQCPSNLHACHQGAIKSYKRLHLHINLKFTKLAPLILLGPILLGEA